VAGPKPDWQSTGEQGRLTRPSKGNGGKDEGTLRRAGLWAELLCEAMLRARGGDRASLRDAGVLASARGLKPTATIGGFATRMGATGAQIGNQGGCL